MAATPSLPNGTVLGKSFEYGLDIKIGGAWQSVRRMSAWAPTYPPTTSDIATYDDKGAPSSGVSGRGFAASFTVQSNRSSTTGLYLPEVEALLAAGKGIGEAAVLEVRWYHRPAVGVANPNDAGTAFVTVEISRQNTGNAEVDTYSVSLTGQGSFEPIVNPYTPDTSVPKIASISPSGRAAGQQVTITGQGFNGATAVKFAAVDATALTVVGNATIVAVVPAGSAGSVNVTVVTPGGTSAAFAYTRA